MTAVSPRWSDQRRTRKISELLARQIVADVVAQGIKPEERLPPEAEMMRAYDVGRATLREALRLLEVQGLIRMKPGPGGGPVLAKLTAREFGEMSKLHLQLAGATYGQIMKARVAIEPAMARLAAEDRSAEQIAMLQGILHDSETVDLTDDSAYIDLMGRFHSAVAGLSGNHVLDLVGEGLKSTYLARLRQALTPLDARPAMRDCHCEIAQAILEGRADDAEKHMKEHMLDQLQLHTDLHPELLAEQIMWD